MLELAATALLDVFFHVELVRNLGEQHVRSDTTISVARWAIDQVKSVPSALDGRRIVHDQSGRVNGWVMEQSHRVRSVEPGSGIDSDWRTQQRRSSP